MATRDTWQSDIERILQKSKINLSADQITLVRSEAIKLYKLHLKSCARMDSAEPCNFERFVIEIAEQVACGIYTPHEPLTEVHDDGIKRLLDEVYVASERSQRLQHWHRQYVSQCGTERLRAYALSLILDAISAADSTFSLFKFPLSDQVSRINVLVSEYVQRTGRKDNPRWYASTPTRKKPSKEFNKYAF